jgi:GntR family transcriptional regulator
MLQPRPTASTVLYREVKRKLLARIESQRWAPGQTLPRESDLAQSFGVSIGTLRRAVDELVHEHVLIRHQGKGTFVAQHSRDRFLFQFFHVEPRGDWPLQPVQRAAEFPRVETLAFERERADETCAAALRLRIGDPVFVVQNRLSLSGQPVTHDLICISAALFKGLTEKRFLERAGTVYQLYQAEFGITVLRAEERARAMPASRQAARVLGVPQGAPLLEVHRLALSFGGRPVEYRVSTISTRLHDYLSTMG